MPGKRSRRGSIRRFHCPVCDSRLWRIGSEKHYLYYKDRSELSRHVGLTGRNAALAVAKGEYVDRNAWIEEFFCGEHGKMWLLTRQRPDGSATCAPATEHDWNRTTGTRHPEHPNPSVSEFTYRMSRGAKA
jgi:hypothetical protein